MVIKNLKLPVWPVHFGVVAQIFDWLGLTDVSEGILEKMGGRMSHFSADFDEYFLMFLHDGDPHTLCTSPVEQE